METLDFIALGTGVLLSALLLGMFFFIVKKERQLRLNDAEASAARIQQLESRLKAITDLELESDRLNGELQRRRTDIEALRVSYAEKKAIYDELMQQVSIFDEKL